MELDVIQQKIFDMRGNRVILDFHLAELYGVETRVLKQAVRRNMDRFPDDFMFTLSKDEWRELITNCDKFPTTAKHNPSLPYAFTEQGVAMLSSVLRSPMAVQVNIAIMRAFVLMRRMVTGYEELRRRIEELELSSNAQFSEIYRVLTEVMSNGLPDETQRRQIGFQSPDESDEQSAEQ